MKNAYKALARYYRNGRCYECCLLAPSRNQPEVNGRRPYLCGGCEREFDHVEAAMRDAWYYMTYPQNSLLPVPLRVAAEAVRDAKAMLKDEA